MEESKIRDFLDNIHVGDYLWIQYRSGLLREKTEIIKGYVGGMDTGLVTIVKNDPPLGVRPDADNNIWYNDIVKYHNFKTRVRGRRARESIR